MNSSKLDFNILFAAFQDDVKNDNYETEQVKKKLKVSDEPFPMSAVVQQPVSDNPYRCAPMFGGWVRRPLHIDLMDYALANLPSTWNPIEVAWVSLDMYVGKWMWFVYESQVDEKFIILAEALQNGLLGDCIKVPPVSCVQKFHDESQSSSNASSSSSATNASSSGSASRSNSSSAQQLGSSSVVPFIVYTKDFRDRDDVLRVGLALRKLMGYSKTISYKPGQLVKVLFNHSKLSRC